MYYFFNQKKSILKMNWNFVSQNSLVALVQKEVAILLVGVQIVRVALEDDLAL